MNIRLLQDKVLIRVDPDPTGLADGDNSAIVLPEAHRRQSRFGTVMGVGPGLRRKKDGRLKETTLRIGDRVTYSVFGGQIFHIEGTEYRILQEYDPEHSLMVVS